MKKLKIVALAALCALCCAAALAGCSGSQGSSQAATTMSSETLVGAWTNMPEAPDDDPAATTLGDAVAQAADEAGASEASDAEEEAEKDSGEASSSEAEAVEGEVEEADADVVELDGDDSEALQDLPLVSTFLNVKEDGTAELFAGGFAYSGTWNIDGSEAKLVIEGTPDITLKFSGEKLVLVQEGTQIELAKSADNSMFADDAAMDMEYTEPVIEDMKAVTVGDDNVATIKVTGKGTDTTGDPCFRLSVTNKSEKTIFVSIEDTFTVNNVDSDAGLGEFVDAGETNDEVYLYFPADDLDNGVESLTDVSGEIVAYSVDEEGEGEVGDAIATYQFKM